MESYFSWGKKEHQGAVQVPSCKCFRWIIAQSSSRGPKFEITTLVTVSSWHFQFLVNDGNQGGGGGVKSAPRGQENMFPQNGLGNSSSKFSKLENPSCRKIFTAEWSSSALKTTGTKHLQVLRSTGVTERGHGPKSMLLVALFMVATWKNHG